MTEDEMSQLRQLADRHGTTISAYAIRRLFDPDPDHNGSLELRHRPSAKKAELYRAISRANLLLDEIRQHLQDADGDLSRPMMRAALLALIAIDDKLDHALVS